MNKAEYEKLLDALWTIKEHCKNNRSCASCMYSEEYTNVCCINQKHPEYWDLPERKNHE